VNVITNPIDAALQGGPRTGDVRGISTAVVDLRGTRSVKVNNRAATFDSTFSGKKEFRLLGYGRDPQITVSQNEPLPLQLNGLIAELMI
jgi:hypothetical protein